MSVDLSVPGGANFALGYAGQISKLSETIIGSRINENATAIEFGRAVAAGASGGTCKPVSGSSDVIVGVSVMSVTMPADYSTHYVNYKQYANVPLMELGKMYVQPVENWADGDAVYALTGQAGQLGSASGGGGASATRLLVPGASFVGAGTANTIGEIKIVGGQTITLGT